MHSFNIRTGTLPAYNFITFAPYNKVWWDEASNGDDATGLSQRIACATGNIGWFTSMGTLNRYSTSTADYPIDCSTDRCEIIITPSLNLLKLAIGKFDSPWIIDNLSDVYKMNCKSSKYFNEVTQGCETTCPNYLVIDTPNLHCKNCQKDGKYFLQGECVTATSCTDSLIDAINGSHLTLSSECKCDNTTKKFFPSGITAYTPIAKPLNAKCVANCSDYYLTTTTDPLYTAEQCLSCFDKNPLFDYFDPGTNTCTNSSGCSIGRIPDSSSKVCTDNCKDVNKLYLHGQCLSGIVCSDLNATSTVTFATHNTCDCTGKKYFPTGITAYTPISKPISPQCVTNCSDYYLSFIVNDQGLGNDKCTSCESINPSLDYFDPSTNTCLSSTSCPIGRSPETTNKYCATCKVVGKLKLHGECFTGTSCADLNASNSASFATDNSCECSSKKYFPTGITAYTPITKPTSPICVTNCSDYYLTYIANDQELGNDKCSSCASIDPSLDYFDPSTNTCVNSTGCSTGRFPDAINKFCTLDCKSVNKLRLHGKCFSNTSCSELNAINSTTFSTDNTCICSGGNKFLPSGIQSYSPITKPTSSKCVTNCSDYYLIFIVNDQGLGNDKCASCSSIYSDKPYYDPITNTCVNSTGCSSGRYPDSEKNILSGFGTSS